MPADDVFAELPTPPPFGSAVLLEPAAFVRFGSDPAVCPVCFLAAAGDAFALIGLAKGESVCWGELDCVWVRVCCLKPVRPRVRVAGV